MKLLQFGRRLFELERSCIRPAFCIQSRDVYGRREAMKLGLYKELLPKIMNSRKIANEDDWRAIQEELLGTDSIVSPVNIDSIIMTFCIQQQNYDLAFKYVDFLRAENKKLNLASVIRYFQLFYLTSGGEQLKGEDEAKVLSTYKEIRESYKVLDARTCEAAIQVLSVTSNWRECLKLLDEIKITCVPPVDSYSITAGCAFRGGDMELGWRLLKEIFENYGYPKISAYLPYLKRCEQISSPADFISSMESLFTYFREYDIRCDIKVAEAICDVYKKMKMQAQITRVDSRGVCLKCKRKLQKTSLSEEQFSMLKNAVFKNIIIGKDVYSGTTPSELRKFQDFVNNMEKYDVVIDGLNVAYSAGTKRSPQVMSSLLTAVVREFAAKNKKTLVLGRKHMLGWPRPSMSYVSQNADIFLTESLSQDDPYLLYCAFNSGLHTIIITRDLMRNHQFKLNDSKLRMWFSQWLAQCQYQVKYISLQGNVTFKYPLSYARIAQQHPVGWHIPCTEDSDVIEDKWLCISHK